MITGGQYHNNYTSKPFVAKNFRGKYIRFAMRTKTDEYVEVNYGGIRNWTFLLTVTPITNNPQHSIQEKRLESFTYTVSSTQLSPQAQK